MFIKSTQYIALSCLLLSQITMAQQTISMPENKKTETQFNQFFYRTGAFKSTVLIVYVNVNFYDLYIWEKEALLKPVYDEQHSLHPTLTTLAIRDAKTGKTVGTFSLKDGVVML